MKKRMTVTVIILCIVLAALAPIQAQAKNDAQEAHPIVTALSGFGGSGRDYFMGMAEAADGFVAAGYSYEESFGTGDWSGTSGRGDDDAIIVRYDRDGAVKWKKNFGGEDEDRFFAVAAASDGFVAVGSSDRSSFGTGDWGNIKGYNMSDAVIVKFDTNGRVVWKHNFESSVEGSRNQFTAVIVTEDGYVALGDTRYVDKPDAVAVKYDFNGNVVWSRLFGGDGEDIFCAGVPAGRGFIAVGSSSEASFGTGDWTGEETKGRTDAIAVRYDADGTILWKQHFGGVSYDYYYAAASTADGFVAAGYSSFTSEGDWEGEKEDLSSILVKYGMDGKIKWKKRMDGKGYYAVAALEDGYLAAGSGMHFDRGDWSGVLGYGGFSDATAVKYDLDGNVEWKERFGGSGDDVFRGILAMENGYTAVGNSEEESFGNGSFQEIEGRGVDDAIVLSWFQKEGPVEYYTVAFDLWGGTGDIPTQNVVEYGLASVPSTEPVRPDSVFLGWYYGDKKWDFEKDTVTEAITLRAKWMPTEAVWKRGNGYVDANGYSLVPLVKGRNIELGIGPTAYDVVESADWSSTNSSVAAFRGKTKYNCMIEAISVGTCEIRAAVQSSYTYYDVVLKRNITTYATDQISHKIRVAEPLSAVSLPDGDITLEAGDGKILTCNTTPAGNYSRAVSDFSFYSSDESVAVVDEYGYVRAVGDGSAVITAAASSFSDVSASCKITVAKKQDPVNPPDVQDPPKPEDPKVYTYQPLSDGTVELTGYTGTNTSLQIPAQIDGKTVSGIGENAFVNCKEIWQASLPDSIKTIGNGAFAYCSNLSSVRLPAGLSEISETAFYGCSSLTEITIPGSVAAIGDFAFFGCENLIKIYLPVSVARIGAEAFGGCSGLRDIDYEGNKEQWTKIAVGENNECLLAAAVHFASSQPQNPENPKDPQNPNLPVVCDHTWSKTVTRASFGENGSIVVACSKCQAVQSESVVYAPFELSLSKETCVYNGKAQKPAVLVKDNSQRTLENGVDYNVTYPKGMKNVGVYTITVRFQGNYSGTVTKEFSIVPKTTSVKKVQAKAGKLTVKWKKQAAQISGYEISCSPDRTFKKGTVKVTAGKNKTSTKLAPKGRGKKTYYVRIRTYKKVKVNGKNVKLCSGWSKSKKAVLK